MEQKNRRKGIVIMGQLIGLVKPLLPMMCVAVFLGVLGYLCAIFLTIFAGYGLLGRLANMAGAGLMTGSVGADFSLAPGALAAVLVMLAVLRKLCPAKLEGRDKGNLISIITSDIELLEVFYAHTISPIVIAVLTSLVMVIFIGMQYPAAGAIASIGYVTVGALIPLWNGKRGAADGMEFRSSFGELNSFLLDSLRGLDETIQYDRGAERMEQIDVRSGWLGQLQKKLNRHEASQSSMTNLAILIFSFGMLFFMLWNYERGATGFDRVLIATIAMMGSFVLVVALSNLSNNLSQTLASGERVLSLLEEEPMITEVSGEKPTEFEGARVQQVSFACENEQILTDYSVEFPKGKIVGIHGASGSGKSTLLKLLMRFWDVNGGNVLLSERNVKQINTADLRNMESYVTQETYLFHDSIANNIAVGKPGASRGEIIAAGKSSVSGSRGRFCMMRRFCCWMSRPVIWMH